MTDPRPSETPLRPDDDCVRITLRIDRAVFARLPQGRTNTETARFALIRAADAGDRSPVLEERLDTLSSVLEAARADTTAMAQGLLRDARDQRAAFAARIDAFARSVHALALEVARIRADTAGLMHALGERVDLASEEARRIMADAQAESEAKATRALEASLTAVSALSGPSRVDNGGSASGAREALLNGTDRVMARAQPTG
ncbi:MAG: hypothetical protein AAF074_23490 [Pseudomonadota bacterium]